MNLISKNNEIKNFPEKIFRIGIFLLPTAFSVSIFFILISAIMGIKNTSSKYFQDIENISGKKIACIKKIALQNNLIDIDNYLKIARSMSKSNYGKYLLNNSNIEDWKNFYQRLIFDQI